MWTIMSTIRDRGTPSERERIREAYFKMARMVAHLPDNEGDAIQYVDAFIRDVCANNGSFHVGVPNYRTNQALAYYNRGREVPMRHVGSGRNQIARNGNADVKASLR
jgi:hypothetical protein